MFVYDRVCTFSCFFSGLLTIVSKIFLEVCLLESSTSEIIILILFVRVQLLIIKKCQFLIAYHLSSHT